jgi:hypothetical protein
VTAAIVSLTACSPSSDGNSRMLQIYASQDMTQYVDAEATMEGKDTVVVDDTNHFRVFTNVDTDTGCPKTVERVLTDESNVFIYFNADETSNCNIGKAIYVEKVTNVSFGDFEKMTGYFFCTTSADCKPVERVLFQRLL